MEKRESFGSRLGFLLVSAGCAIGCGNVWKFPWMCGKYGGGAFVLVYLICLLVLGLPCMVVEFALGRASQASPVRMHRVLEPKGTKWHAQGGFSLAGNMLLMMFYTVVSGWMLYYFVQFVSGGYQSFFAEMDVLGETGEATKVLVNNGFGTMQANPWTNVGYMGIVVGVAFVILTFNFQKGMERVSKVMMVLLFVLMAALGVHSLTLSGAKEGLNFYLVPDFSKISGSVIVGAMNQAFFTLSLGIGSMAIFGSYLGKERSLLGESASIICLDTLVALMAGLIIFPACYTYGIEPGAGPGLLFETMATVFGRMNAGRLWGSLFFLFMVFASMSTVLAVCENILACVRELTGWDRKTGCLVCGVAVCLLSLPCALGFNLWKGFVPFAAGTSFLDLWDFLVSNILLPTGTVLYVAFAVNKNAGWGWDNFLAEANTGEGLKLGKWTRPLFEFVVPVLVVVVMLYGLITFSYR